jgi:hypothetical protein
MMAWTSWAPASISLTMQVREYSRNQFDPRLLWGYA